MRAVSLNTPCSRRAAENSIVSRHPRFIPQNDPGNQSALIADGFALLSRRQTERPLHRLRRERGQIELGHFDRFFHCLLPRLERPAADFQSFHHFDVRVGYRRKLAHRRAQLRNRTRHHAQESHAHQALRLLTSLHQDFGLHRPGIRAALRVAVNPRIHHAKIESLPVLHGRRPVGIKHVALVEHGFHDCVHHRGVHERTVSGRALKALSSASSHVGIPSRTLY